MENVIIFGASTKGSMIKRKLEETKKYKVRYFCDNNSKKWKETLNSIEIISIDDVKSLCINGFEGIIVISVCDQWQVVEQIQNVREVQLPVYGIAWGCINQGLEINKVLYYIDITKPYLDYIEYHVSDHCNLKCRGCGHYSNLSEPHFGNLSKYFNDLKRLKDMFWGIKTIRLMGGEPLLNKELPEFISCTRDIFPDSDIMVVTNGLLIPNIDEKLLITMYKYFVRFDISLYPPTSRLKEKIELKCIEYNIDYHFSMPIEIFYDNFNYSGNSDKNIAYEKCGSGHCHFLEDGHISVCGLPILYKKYQNKLQYKMEMDENDIINLYDPELDGFKLKELLSKPMQICRYCSDKEKRYFNWQGNYPYCEN